MKKFYAIIGNPPYQSEGNGNIAYAPPIYHEFMDASYDVAERVELITPARFLFNAGSTPKAWNKKMLNDEHLKVQMFEAEATNVFPNTNIKGGVAVTYRDTNRDFGAIGVFTAYAELNSIIKKVVGSDFVGLDSVVSNRGACRFSEAAYRDYPEEMKKISDSRILSGAFERFPSLFFENRPEDGLDYLQVYGLMNGQRVFRWLRFDYVAPFSTLDYFKVVISKADGAAGQIGAPVPARICGRPYPLKPGVAFTETFLSIGKVDSQFEAESICRYIRTKFARTMLGVLKVTQDNTRPTWHYVPLQEFTASSDINWSKPVAEIDQQLYRKYGLDASEIEFIESHVKEMS